MKKILFYNSGGGLGDSIQLFSLILSLQNHFRESEFFYLSGTSRCGVEYDGQLVLQSSCGTPWPTNIYVAKFHSSNGSINWITQTSQNTHRMDVPLISISDDEIQLYSNGGWPSGNPTTFGQYSINSVRSTSAVAKSPWRILDIPLLRSFCALWLSAFL